METLSLISLITLLLTGCATGLRTTSALAQGVGQAGMQYSAYRAPLTCNTLYIGKGISPVTRCY